jgi:hypothetical protein
MAITAVLLAELPRRTVVLLCSGDPGAYVIEHAIYASDGKPVPAAEWGAIVQCPQHGCFRGIT